MMSTLTARSGTQICLQVACVEVWVSTTWVVWKRKWDGPGCGCGRGPGKHGSGRVGGVGVAGGGVWGVVWMCGDEGGDGCAARSGHDRSWSGSVRLVRSVAGHSSTGCATAATGAGTTTTTSTAAQPALLFPQFCVFPTQDCQLPVLTVHLPLHFYYSRIRLLLLPLRGPLLPLPFLPTYPTITIPLSL